ncbi:ATP-dependent RNA helicase DbpA, partial [Pseudoalteromonas sp. S4488]
MGFQDTLDAIVECIPNQPQTLLLSETKPKKIAERAERVLSIPEMIKVEEEQTKSTIKHYFYMLDNYKQRFNRLKLVLLKFQQEG